MCHQHRFALTWREPDDETDMKALESTLRSIEIEGLTWGASKLVPVGYGISKLQINVVVEDDKVSIDDLQARIESDEDHVQSTDVVRHIVHDLASHADRLFSLGGYAKALELRNALLVTFSSRSDTVKVILSSNDLWSMLGRQFSGFDLLCNRPRS